MSSNKVFVKYVLQDNHLVRHSLINTVDAMAFKNRKANIKGNHEPSENFETDILAEGVLDKALVVIRNNPDGKYMIFLTMTALNNMM